MKVVNIKGTANRTCKCGSWLQHWINCTRQPVPLFCAVEGCLRSPKLGAHVRYANESHGKHYIIPMCSTHNESTEVLSIKAGIDPVSANKSETCELWS
jgi:hypothetical protein